MKISNIFCVCAIFVLPSCATIPQMVYEGPSDEELNAIQEEVRNGSDRLRESLPTLQFITNMCSGFMTSKHFYIKSMDHKRHEVVALIKHNGLLWGGLALAYLKNAEGKIVDWESDYVGDRERVIGVKMIDVNDDGVKELCFIAEGSGPDEPDFLLSAHGVRGNFFYPLSAACKARFDIKFQSSTADGGILIEPQLKGIHNWASDQLYDVPIKLMNRSDKTLDVNNFHVETDDARTKYLIYTPPDKLKLEPGESVEAMVTILLTPALENRDYKFKLLKYESFRPESDRRD